MDEEIFILKGEKTDLKNVKNGLYELFTIVDFKP